MLVSHITALNKLPNYPNAIFILTLTSFLCFSPTHSRLTEGKEKDDPKTIPLKIFAKDIGNCAYVRYVLPSVIFIAAISTNMNNV